MSWCRFPRECVTKSNEPKDDGIVIEKYMTKKHFSDLPYRPCAGIVLLNNDNLIFCAQRIDAIGDAKSAWQMPQGGINKNEAPRAAALRELEEEIGTNKAEIIAEMEEWVTYDLPDHLLGKALRGKYRGQRQKWFAMRFLGEDQDINLETAEPEFHAWKWITPEELLATIVEFKFDVYNQVVKAFSGILNSES